MQLGGKSSIRGALTAMTAMLLGGGVAHAEGERRLESSLLLYSEVDRVQAAEAILGLSMPLKGNRLFNARLTLDGLTGASPNGATPSATIQTFTRPSGTGAYSVKPGEIPLDDTFKDSRYSVDGSLTQEMGRFTTVDFGAHFSGEHDYTSLGVNVGLTQDLNRKNTTVGVSGAYSHDIVRPEGGAPVPLASMAASSGESGEREEEGDDDHEGGTGSGKGKDVLDGVVSVTQVLGRKTLVRVNYSINRSSGYLNDPYKLLSVVQGRSSPQPGEPVDYLYESRPGSHTKQALYAQVRRYLGGHTVDLSYRYFWSSWGITSNTVDLYYRLPLGGDHALQPHLRYYRQTAADFYHTYLVDGNVVPEFASADYRLAPFHAITVGLQYIFPVANGAHISLGGEYYHQAGDLSPPVGMGALSQYDLFPTLDAIMVRMGFGYDF